ncbi:MAG: response regulator [Cellvibrionales bacterium]|nr:response regulator [Cellvibrionales bacterium]
MLKNLSIGIKIAFIAIVGFVGILIFQSANYRLSVNLRDQLQQVFHEDFIVLKFSNDIQINFADLDKLFQAALIEGDMDTLREAELKAKSMQKHFASFKKKYRLNTPAYRQLMNVFNEYVEVTSNHTIAVLSGQLGYQQTLMGYDQIGDLRLQYETAQSVFFEQCYAKFEDQMRVIQDEGRFLVDFGLMLGIVLTLILGIISFFVINNLINAINNVVNLAHQIASGNFDQKIKPKSQDETGKMLLSLKAMRDALKKQRDDDIQREYIKDFISGLNETSRGDPSLDHLLNAVITYLADQFSASAAKIYLFENQQLHLKSNLNKNTTQAIQETYETSYLSEVAQSQKGCLFKDLHKPRKPMLLDDSGNPLASMMLAPIYTDSKALGLIELGAQQTFTNEDLWLLEKINDALANAINSAISREALADMLLQTQQQAEKLKSQRHELEVSGRYKSQFLSTMSHELRTPLNSILILSESLINNRNGTLSQQEIQHARVIHNAGSDLLTLINDILDLSKIEEGKMDVVWEKFDIRQLAEDLFHAFELQAKNKGLEYKVSVSDDVPSLICSDSLRLKQIIQNFISNALKFTEIGGIYITFKAIPNLSTDNKNLQICVRDTGVGIANAKQKDVFEAFKQLDGTTSRKYGGTGLGLSISRALAKILRGKVGLYSEGENKGSLFSLTIPIDAHFASIKQRTKSKYPLLRKQKPNTSALSTQKVLIIEDNPVLIQTMKTVFAANDVMADIEASGQSALAAMKQNFYSCLIVDFNLPDIEGLALLSAIRQIGDYHYAPLIVFTAEDLTRDETMKVKQLADHIFLKTPRAIQEVCLLSKNLLNSQFEQTQQDKESDFNFENHHLLLVDDDERNLYSLSLPLREAGLKVTTAQSGEKALELLETDDSIDILLLDIMMPVMDGYQVIQQIKKRELPDIPIIAITAKAMNQDRARCLAAGAKQYLAKPIEVKDLLHAIQTECMAIVEKTAQNDEYLNG